MLALSPQASDAIKSLVESADLPDGAGLRIATTEAPEPASGGALSLGLAEAPAEDDQVVEEAGASVFLDADAAQLLDNALLDATVQGDQIGFRVSSKG